MNMKYNAYSDENYDNLLKYEFNQIMQCEYTLIPDLEKNSNIRTIF